MTDRPDPSGLTPPVEIPAGLSVDEQAALTAGMSAAAAVTAASIAADAREETATLSEDIAEWRILIETQLQTVSLERDAALSALETLAVRVGELAGRIDQLSLAASIPPPPPPPPEPPPILEEAPEALAPPIVPLSTPPPPDEPPPVRKRAHHWT